MDLGVQIDSAAGDRCRPDVNGDDVARSLIDPEDDGTPTADGRPFTDVLHDADVNQLADQGRTVLLLSPHPLAMSKREIGSYR